MSQHPHGEDMTDSWANLVYPGGEDDQVDPFGQNLSFPDLRTEWELRSECDGYSDGYPDGWSDPASDTDSHPTSLPTSPPTVSPENRGWTMPRHGTTVYSHQSTATHHSHYHDDSSDSSYSESGDTPDFDMGHGGGGYVRQSGNHVMRRGYVVPSVPAPSSQLGRRAVPLVAGRPLGPMPARRSNLGFQDQIQAHPVFAHEAIHPPHPSMPPSNAAPTPAASPKAAESSSDAEICPLCHRGCEEHHRLGMFWRKFGYDGPPYCSRCSSVFRAHMVTRTVSELKCSRQEPCLRCLTILRQFKVARADAFQAMDAAQPQKNAKTESDSTGGEPQPACPHCQERNHPGLGLYWRKFGYCGPAYCGNCSASFRNHIIRQRSTKRDCSRDKPCASCEKVLQHFEGTRSTVFSLMDNKKRAPPPPVTKKRSQPDPSREGGGDRSQTAMAQIKSEPYGANAFAVMEAPAYFAERAEFDKRPRIALPGGSTRRIAVSTFASLGLVAMVGVAFCWLAVTFSAAPGPNGAAETTSATDSPGWCHGAATHGMTDQAAFCDGPVGSVCEYHCLPGWVANGTHICKAGETIYTGGNCDLDWKSAAEWLAIQDMLNNMHNDPEHKDLSNRSGSVDTTGKPAPPVANVAEAKPTTGEDEKGRPILADLVEQQQEQNDATDLDYEFLTILQKAPRDKAAKKAAAKAAAADELEQQH